MSELRFADIVHDSIAFSLDQPGGKLIAELIDTCWVQRLRDVCQTANTKLVYMFSEHSRFGHSLGVAYLAQVLLAHLRESYPERVKEYELPLCAAAILHDVGHLAPGSHTAFKTWFPGQPDIHEEIGIKIIREDPEISRILKAVGDDCLEKTIAILQKDDSLPAWTWQMIAGAGWNVDRGNWCMVDSIMAGVNYGKYNIDALIGSLELTDDGQLALRENRLDAMMHFALSRHAMYSQIYHHRVLLAADMLNIAIVKRARKLLKAGGDPLFMDAVMENVLTAQGPEELSLEDIYAMRESWWGYHLSRWQDHSDETLSDLCSRLVNRKLLKMFRLRSSEDEEKVIEESRKAVADSGYDPDYYLFTVSTVDMQRSEGEQSIKVKMDDGEIRNMSDVEPLYTALVDNPQVKKRTWVVLPEEAKKAIGRKR